MKLFNSIIAAGLTLGSLNANAQTIKPEDVLKAAATFEMAKRETLTGTDSKGRKCEISYGLGDNVLSASATVFVTANGVETADIGVFRQSTTDKILELSSQGSARTNGTFKVKQRETVPKHKTDFGFLVLKYDVDYTLKLTFENGRLVKSDVTKTRPGLSNLVFDPDFRGGKVESCKY